MLDERELVRLCVAGDKRAFERLYREHVGLVTSICWHSCVGADIEDLVQTVFLNVHKALPTYEFRDSKLAAWIGTIARNACIGRAQSGRMRYEVVDQELVEKSEMAVPEIDNGYSGITDEMVAAIETLNPVFREVLTLYADGKAYKEIAAELGIPQGTVMSRLFRARRGFQVEYERLTQKQGEGDMTTQRNAIPVPANYGRVLKVVVKTYLTAEWLTTGMLNGIPGIRQEIENFDAPTFVKEALKKGDLDEVVSGSKFCLKRTSRSVIKAAMEVGRIAGLGKAGEKAGEIYNDADDFQAFCQEVYGLNSSWFELKTYEVQIRKSLKLDHEFWPLDSLELLFKELAGYAPSIILVQGVVGGGYKYRIELPKHLLPVEPSIPAQADLDDEDDDDDVTEEQAPSVTLSAVPEVQPEGEALAKEVPMSVSTQPTRDVSGQICQYLFAMLRHYDRHKVMSTGDVTKKLGYLDVRWTTTKGTGWLFLNLKKAGALIQCDAEGALSEKPCGYVRFNLEHPQVKEAGKVKVRRGGGCLSDEEMSSLTSGGFDIRLLGGPLGRRPYPESEPETTVTENVEPNEPGSPVLTSEDKKEEVTLSFTPPVHTRAELEEQIRQVQAHQLQDSEERREIAEKIRELQARDLELSQMAPLREQEIVHLEQELTRLEHAKQEAAKRLEVILGKLTPFEIEMLKEKLLEQG